MKSKNTILVATVYTPCPTPTDKLSYRGCEWKAVFKSAWSVTLAVLEGSFDADFRMNKLTSFVLGERKLFLRHCLAEIQ